MSFGAVRRAVPTASGGVAVVVAVIAHSVDGALRERHQPLAAVLHHEHAALAGGLLTPRVHHARPRDERAAERRPQIVDLVFARHHARPERQRAGEREGVVGEIADDPAVHEPVLLLEFVAHEQAQREFVGADVHQLRTQQHAERLRVQRAARAIHQICHHCPLGPRPVVS
ncbi:hypothetical protein PT2222_100360 [Paraburkholderia tropica]